MASTSPESSDSKKDGSSASLKPDGHLTVLVVGASGMLGSKIVAALTAKENVTVKGLVRDVKGIKNERLSNLVEKKKVELVEGDLNDKLLASKLDKVDVVVSAVQGGPDVIIDGQTQLLTAAQKAGVKKFIPSVFSFNLFGLKDGDNINSDWRRKFNTVLESSGMNHSSIINGCFTEVFFGFLGVYDAKASTLRYYGDGETKFELTTTDDIALYTAEAAVDLTAPKVVAVAGDVVSMKDVIKIWSKVGRKPELKGESVGTVDEGIAERIKRQKADPSNVYSYLPLMYQLAMVSGASSSPKLSNDSYPHVKPENLEQFLSKREDLTKM